MQYTKGIYIVCNVQSRSILYAVYKAFDKILQNPTKFYKMRHFNVEYCRTYKIEA